MSANVSGMKYCASTFHGFCKSFNFIIFSCLRNDLLRAMLTALLTFPVSYALASVFFIFWVYSRNLSKMVFGISITFSSNYSAIYSSVQIKV